MPRHKMPDAVKQYFVKMGRKGGSWAVRFALHISVQRNAARPHGGPFSTMGSKERLVNERLAQGSTAL